MISEIKGSRLRVIQVGGGIEVVLVQNTALEALLLDRNLIGLPFRSACRAATELFLRHLADELPREAAVSELAILSKGLVYQVADAYGTVFGKNLPMNLIATRRATVDQGVVSIEVTYRRFDAGGSSLIIGDTVASGATMCAALNEYAAAHALVSVTVLSYAGSIVGAERVAAFCSDRGISLRLVYGLAAFGLAPNGFDLSFLDPATVTDPSYVDRARALFAGRPVSAVGWDFGSQAMAPLKYRYLSWIEAERWGLLGTHAFAVAIEPPDRVSVEREAPSGF